MKKIFVIFIFIINFSLVYCQPYIKVSNVPLQTLIKDTLINICNPNAVKNITTPVYCNQYSYFNRNNSAFPFESGLLLTTGYYYDAPGPDNSSSKTGFICTQSDPDLAILSGNPIYDISKIEFDFTPNISPISFRYIFASEEFPEFVNFNFNDAFGFFLSGPGISGPFTNGAINIAVLPNGQAATINNIYNSGIYYVGALDPSLGGNNNPAISPYGNSIQFDGASIILTATANVQIGQTYHIKLVVGDSEDSEYDSAVFLEAGNFIIQEEMEVKSVTNGNGTQVGQTAITTLTCNNSSIQIQAFGGTSYHWDGGSFPNQALNTITESGTYNVTISDAVCNKTEIHTIQIQSNIIPPIAEITSPVTDLNDSTVSIQLTATGGDTYNWSDKLGTNANVIISLPGIYTVTVTNQLNGCTASAILEITQNFDPLPVTWLNFTGKGKDNFANLIWKTATETNSYFFIVQKSYNATDFEDIGEINATGFSNEIKEYNFVDNNFEKSSYYRLKQIDFDGKSDFSKIIYVEKNQSNNNPEIYVYPNPNNGIFKINISNIENIQKILIFDVNGKIIIEKDTNNDYLQEEFNPQLKSGVYFLKAITPNNNYIVKIFVN
ncbi:MAG: T9SS type A sorting domain-containing protein [Bacteroidales bacterium]|jgi:sporulation protein YlmC with PRC-barrel domain|nr:T9SS type A sorting domain-containing protein [Bacteroidales bacterium]